MIRSFLNDIFGGNPRGHHTRAPVTDTLAPTTKAVAWPLRAPPVPPLAAAAYWRAGLDFLNFAEMARTGEQQVQPLWHCHVGEVAARAALAAGDTEKASVEEGTEVNLVLGLWQLDRHGKTMRGGVRHPLLSVPATLVQEQFLAPRLSAATEWNTRYLGPDIQAGCFNLGEREAADAMLEQVLTALLGERNAAPGWATWWNTSLLALQRLLHEETLPAIQARLERLANELRKQPLQWAMVTAAYPVSGGGTKAIAEVYDNLLVLEGHQHDTALFHHLCSGSAGGRIATLADPHDVLLTGHIDEYEGGKRSLFPLDQTQRNAVRAILALRPGELQAVNGPPGSGKTAMLRAVVASTWVTAALQKLPCPIIVACGSTNQSVTNVIGAFGKAPHPDASLPHAQRWIDDAPSYGAFLPSASYKAELKNQAEMARNVCIEKVSSPASHGFLYSYFQRKDVLAPGRALDDERIYLARAHAALGTPFDTVEEAVDAVWARLAQTNALAQAFLHTNQDDSRRTHGLNYLSNHAQYWTQSRAEAAINALEKADTATDFADLAWRAEAFHWAARYWEGQFLLSQRTRLLSRHPNNVEEALRRMCMLTPCLVSTLHSVPQFAQIDRNATDQDEQRSHVFGVIDLLVLDEAGQALPEMAGAAFALARRAAVIGDMKQLAPITTTSRLGEMAIAQRAGTTLELDAIIQSRRSVVSGSALGMARLVSRWNDADEDGVTLRYHYRCKPSIIEYCNLLCYGKVLQPKTNESAAFPESALGWVNIDATPRLSGGSHMNSAEADAIAEWLAERWTAWQQHPATCGKAIQDIVAIVTPYRAQAQYLLQRLQAVFDEARGLGGNWPTAQDIRKVTIGTVHRLQGAERPLVCFSLVEGPTQASTSFIDRDTTLMNVAVSRAKSSFVIFANPKRLFPTSATDIRSLAPVHQLGWHLRHQPEAKLLYPDKLVLIEAGGKLDAMRSILGKSCSVLATGGALFRLPLADGVHIEAGFVPHATAEANTAPLLHQALAVLDSVGELVLATDDDRMGEFIAWQALRALGTGTAGKRIGRARLGAITAGVVKAAFANPDALDEGKILAEALREVVDCLVTQRFAQLAHRQPTGEDALLANMAATGACTASTPGKTYAVGRVQAAILRMLLDQARHVIDCAAQWRVCATVNIDGGSYTGHLINLTDQRDFTDKQTALHFTSQQPQRRLVALGLPLMFGETAAPPQAGTIDILAGAWERKFLKPWEVMHSLQTLYDGSWTQQRGTTKDILAPVPELAASSGHPPLRPLDLGASPEQMRSVMNRTDHAVYNLIWDHYLAESDGPLDMAYGCFTYGLSSSVGVKFETLRCSGANARWKDLIIDRTTRQRHAGAAGLENVLPQLNGAIPVYTAEPYACWDLRPDDLLRQMAQRHIGRPSTFSRALQSLHDKKLLQFPLTDGPLQLTPDGLATALALEAQEPALSAPGFSAALGAQLDDIENGRRGPREVLLGLMPALAPSHDPVQLQPRIWNTLEELESAMDRHAPAMQTGPMTTRGDGGGASKGAP